MNLAILRPRTQMLLAVVVPLGCFFVGLFVVCPPVSHWRKTVQELRTTETAITEKQEVIDRAQASAQGRTLSLAVAEPSEQEPIIFLRQFADLCAQSHVTLLSAREATSPQKPAPRRASSSSATSQNQLGGFTPVVPTEVSEVTDQIAIEGTFGDILSLLVRIECFERILSVNRCHITGASSSYPRLHADFTLSRFVAKSPASAPPPEPASDTAVSAS